jgi:hypothetical protein
MYQNNPFLSGMRLTTVDSGRLRQCTVPPTTLLRIESDPDGGAVNAFFVQQLRSVLVELLTALSRAFNDERDSAEECLRRAAAILTEAEPRAAAGQLVKGAWHLAGAQSDVTSRQSTARQASLS